MYSLIPRVYRSGTRAHSMYMQNFSLGRRLIFANFLVLWLFAKGFPLKIWGRGILGAAKASNPREFSSQKSFFFFINSRKLSPSKFPLYGIASSS